MDTRPDFKNERPCEELALLQARLDWHYRAGLGLKRLLTKLRQPLPPELFGLASIYSGKEILDQRREVERVEGLRDVVDTTELQPARLVAQLRPGGQEHDRDVRGPLVFE